jgi:hypothetical protein
LGGSAKTVTASRNLPLAGRSAFMSSLMKAMMAKEIVVGYILDAENRKRLPFDVSRNPLTYLPHFCTMAS